MGLGDWLMATAEVKRLNERTDRPVVVTNHTGRVFWSPPIFMNNPRISQDAKTPDRVINFPGHRPYIAARDGLRWHWKQWDIEPGEIYFSRDELAAGSGAAGHVMIEPHVKLPGGNKEWPFRRWQQVVDALPEVRFVQARKPGTSALRGVTVIDTVTFRQAAALLANALAFVGCEGGLHHAAAAVETPAVVLWSEFIAPEFTGYQQQVNIRHANGTCGSRQPCTGCRAAMAAITTDEVVAAVRSIL